MERSTCLIVEGGFNFDTIKRVISNISGHAPALKSVDLMRRIAQWNHHHQKRRKAPCDSRRSRENFDCFNATTVLSFTGAIQDVRPSSNFVDFAQRKGCLSGFSTAKLGLLGLKTKINRKKFRRQGRQILVSQDFLPNTIKTSSCAQTNYSKQLDRALLPNVRILIGRCQTAGAFVPSIPRLCRNPDSI